MPFFRDLTTQARDVFAAMPLQSRIIAILLVLAISISLGFLVRGDGSPSMEYLLGDQVLSESELTAADLAFGKAQLSGWSRQGRRIQVPAASRGEFLAALQESAVIPAGLQSHVQRALETMSPFESAEIQRARLMLGNQQDVAKSLEQFDDIRHASVKYSVGERRPFDAESRKSAAVMVTPEGTSPLTKPRLMQIQQYVANAFGMPVDDVNVTDVNSSGLSLLDATEDPLLRRQREVEEAARNKIRSQLSWIEDVRVEVRAEIDPTLGTENTTLSYDPQPTTLMEKSRKIASQAKRPMVGGVPGTIPNAIGNRAQSLDENAQSSTLSDDTKESSRVVGQRYQQSQTAGLLPTKITATIVVPTSYYDRLWTDQQLRENPGVAADKLAPLSVDIQNRLRDDTTKKIQEIVTALLPSAAAGEDSRPMVIVKDMPDLRRPVVEESKSMERALTWLASSWQNVALLTLGLFALLIARSAAKSTRGGSTPPEFAEGFGLELPAPPPELAAEKKEGDKMTITGTSLKDELVSLVEANPEVAANVIRGWVGEAA